MGGPVRVNSRTVVTTKSGGASIAFGDVCELPDGTMLPFVNVAKSEDLVDGARSVRVHGVPVALARSRFGTSTGDEPGKKGGAISGTTQGAAEFTTFSTDVRIEGQAVPRAHDSMVHNLDSNGLPNAWSPMEMQDIGALDADFEMICKAICWCHAIKGRGGCVQMLLAKPIWQWDPVSKDDGGGSSVYWDPHVPPGFYVEPSYQMKPPPPRPMLSPTVKSTMLRDPSGNPLPLPGGDKPPVAGSRRPDVIVPEDPTQPLGPPGPRNIKRIFEIKFPGDKPRRGQLKDYGKIAGDRSKVSLVGPGPESCDCAGKRQPDPKLLPVPVPVKARDEEPSREPSKLPLVVAVSAAIAFGVVLVVTKNPAVAGGAAAAAAAGAAVIAGPTNEEEPET